MIRTVDTDLIIKNVKEMCIEANHYLSGDMDAAMKQAAETEKSPLGKKILEQLQENLKIADEEMIPICQDTGMAVLFLEVGQDVHFEGMAIEDAINEGVRQGYTEGYLRKSVVKDPLIRENTRDNTPAVIHYSIVPGDKVKITMAPKGFGSENMSRVFMLKPADGIEGVNSVCERPGRRNVTENQRAWNRTGRAWRNDHSACRQHQHLSDAHCRASCGSQYLLSCQPSCGTGTVETYFYRRKRIVNRRR